MYLLVAFGVFILGFITRSFAVCPENPKLRAEECGAVFTRFGKAGQQGPEAVLQICSEVYGALDCLREIMNDCEVYTNMGLQMSLEDYKRTKSGIDAVCAGSQSQPGPDVNKCQAKMAKCQIFGSQLSTARDQPTVCRVLKQYVDCNHGVATSCDTILPNQVKQDMATTLQQYNNMCETSQPGPPQALSVTPMGCGLQLQDCTNMITSLSTESGPDVYCDQVEEARVCFDDLLVQCSVFISARTVNTIQSNPVLQSCGPGLMQGGPGPMQVGPGPMQGGPMQGGTEPMQDGPGPLQDLTQSNSLSMRASETKCKNMSESCVTIVESLGNAGGQREICNGMTSMLSCLQTVLTECADKIPNSNEVYTQMTAYQQQLGLYCNSNENEIGGPGLMQGGPGPMQGGPGPMQGGPMQGGPRPMQGGPGPIQGVQCQNKIEECQQYGAQLEVAGAQGLVAACAVMRQYAECSNQVLADCGSLLPEVMKQGLATIGQQYKEMCVRDDPADISNSMSPVASKKRGLDVSVEKRNPVSATECGTMSQDCLRLISQINFGGGQQQLCSGMQGMVDCMDNVVNQCEYVLPNIQDVQQKLKKAKSQVQSLCGNTANPAAFNNPSADEMRCAGKLQTCSSLVSAIPLSSPPSALCPKAREAIACVREMASTCSNVVPPQSLLDFQRATQPFQQLCDGDGLTDTSLASNTILSPSECGSMVQECGSMVNQIDFSDMQETCSGLRGMVQCMENVGDSCGDLFPQIEGQLNKTRDQIKSVCGNVATDTGVTINPVVIECKDKLKTCNAILADVPSQTSTDVMCPHAKKLTSCVDQLFSQCSKIVPVQTLMKFELSIEPFVKMCENPATTQLPVTEYVETSTVITLDKKPSVTLQDCGNKIQKCMTMFNSFSFENGKKSMCMDLKKMLECNENTVFQCRNVVPAGVQAQIEGQLKKAKDNFEFTCPGNNKVPKKNSGRFPPAKCEALISKCKRKLVGYEAGNKEKCLQGYKTMRCYRRVAKVCKLARPIRKEIKAFKKSHINTCGKKKPRDVDDVYDLDDSYIAWLDSDNIDAD